MADKNKKISKKLAARFTAFRDKAAKETIKRLANPQRGKNTDLGKDVVRGLGGYSMGGKVPKGYHRMPNGKLMKDSAMKKKMGGGMMKKPMGYDKGGIKDFISRVKGEKSANKVHSKDHPDVQNLAEKIYKKNVKKMFPLGNNTKRNTKIYDKAVTKAQRVADSMQSIMSKNRSKTEGSFSTGGEAKVRGMGAAIKGGKFQGVF